MQNVGPLRSDPQPRDERALGPVLLYDGVCAMCDRAVQFVLRHDTANRFHFAALQSDFARQALARHGCEAGALDTMYLLLGAGTSRERLVSRSDAILAILRGLGGGWRLLALARVLPRRLRDRAYDFIARNRYRWFGRYQQCVVPSAQVRARFLDS